jgi:TBC1 domain family member 15
VNKELTHSFAELDLFGEQGNMVAKFMKDLHDRPFETTLTAFSKLTGVVTSGINGSLRPYEESDEHAATFSGAAASSMPHGEEYEVIASEAESVFVLPPR